MSYVNPFIFIIFSGKRPIDPPEQAELTTANFLLPTSVNVNLDFKKKCR
jgi:hypothetical protein